MSSYISVCLFFKVPSAVSSSLNSSIFQNNLLAEKLNDGLIQRFSVFGVHQIYLRRFSKMQVWVLLSELSNLNLRDDGRKDIPKFSNFELVEPLINYLSSDEHTYPSAARLRKLTCSHQLQIILNTSLHLGHTDLFGTLWEYGNPKDQKNFYYCASCHHKVIK